MRNRLLGVIGAASMTLATLLATSTGATAFSGLSDKQKAHIDEYIMCKILLWTDIPTYEATEPCGGTPSGSRDSLADTSGVEPRRYNPDEEYDPCEYSPASYKISYEIPNCDYR